MMQRITGEIIEIPLNKVKPNPDQPRKDFDGKALKDLVESFKVNGQLDPITVTRKGSDWEIVSGERRLEAAKSLSFKTIKAIEKEYTDEKKKRIEMIVENIQRENLKEEEKYKYFKKMMDTDGIKNIQELSKKTGVSATTLKNLFEIYETRQELPEDLKKGATSAIIMETLGLKKEERKKVIEYAIKKQYGGRAVRIFTKKLKGINKDEVKKAIFEDDISMEQGESISKLKDKNEREHAINEHKALKVVEKNIVKNISNKNTAKEKRELQNKLAKTETWIKGFKTENIATLRQLEKTIKVLLMAVNHLSVMDENQKERLMNELELFISKCERGQQLAEQIKEKIE